MLFLLVMISTLTYSQNFVKTTPKWYTNPPKERGKIIGVGSGSSADIEVAESKAIMNAKVQLAKQVEPVIRKTYTKIDSVAKGDKIIAEKVTVVTEAVKAELNGSVIVEKAFKRKKGHYTAYVLVKMDVKDMKKSFVEKVRNDEYLAKKLTKKGSSRSLVDDLELD